MSKQRIGLHSFSILLVALLLYAAGCSQSPPGSQRDEIQTLRHQNENLLTQTESLRERNQKLQDALELLKSAYDDLNVQKEELQRWSRDLVKACGPSVWEVSGHEFPLPYKFIKNATLEQLLLELNALMRAKGLPEVVFEQVKEATAYVRIPQDTILTQQMGTSGAEAYLNAVTYTLCSLNEINCVNFDFRPGDHATPGKFCLD